MCIANASYISNVLHFHVKAYVKALHPDLVTAIETYQLPMDAPNTLTERCSL